VITGLPESVNSAFQRLAADSPRNAVFIAPEKLSNNSALAKPAGWFNHAPRFLFNQMSLLPDHEIRTLCEKHSMVVPFCPELLNPSSLDVTLGSTILVEVVHTREMQPVDISGTSKLHPYHISPQEFFLGQTEQLFNIPEFIAARFALKSSRAREGIEHLLAGFADPGFNKSVMTLELQNAKRFHSVPVWAGMRIGQMTFEYLSSPPEISYAIKGHYNGDTTVTPSKGYF